MPTPLKRAKYYRDLAAKCVQLADRATPDGLCEFYRKLAGQYLKLVEAELTLEEKGRSLRDPSKR
jgi:hypothetical protein